MTARRRDSRNPGARASPTSGREQAGARRQHGRPRGARWRADSGETRPAQEARAKPPTTQGNGHSVSSAIGLARPPQIIEEPQAKSASGRAPDDGAAMGTGARLAVSGRAAHAVTARLLGGGVRCEAGVARCAPAQQPPASSASPSCDVHMPVSGTPVAHVGRPCRRQAAHERACS